MRYRDLLRLVVANLQRMRGRVALTSVGVMIGTAAVVLLISLGIGLQTSAMASLESFGDLTTVTVFAGGAFGGPVQGPAPEPMDDAVLREFGSLPGVVAVTPRVGIQGRSEFGLGQRTTTANLVGVDADAAENFGWEMAAGSFRLGRGLAVLGSEVTFESREARAGSRARVGSEGRAGRSPTPLPPDALQDRTVNLKLTRINEDGDEVVRTERLRVAGVLENQGGENDFSVFVALGQLQDWNVWLTGERPRRDGGYQQAIVKVEDRSQVEAVQAEITDRGYQSISAQTILQGLNQVFLIIQAVLGGVGGVALVVAAVGIANTMTMAIYERTREIGIMKALGATNRDVLQVFLAEAGAIGVLGGLLGVLLGAGGGFVLDFLVRNVFLAQQGPPPEEGFPHLVVTPIWLMAFALGFSALVGVISGIYPALRAAGMKPLAALRTE